MADHDGSRSIESNDGAEGDDVDGGTTARESADSDGDEGAVTVTAGPGGDLAVRVPPSATREEAAAIVAAIGTHVGDLERATDGAEPDWHGRRWAFAGRLSATRGRADRVPLGAPLDEWSAASRADRF